ncbi:MAG: hypothetical protein UR89_C0012G0007 [Candidatus Roizmanbacteria bacterium GW2011_GWA2_35_8]|uniref:Uncharacterized protein n=1 Tax=Candidatus Roizmanbacteria bacterium GW2011_GWA2_35_8 TaxID=1618479 RepID=A0A0G0FH91_9BACT|nr:MAG: hypothetical protein UR89_C0012G0007 [Candidatus Roizmanbacteria bacterium GW2011_GWA2_35_8]
MDRNLNKETSAIDAAINADWNKAIILNKEIIKEDKKNVDAHLRLGFAYLQDGKIQLAKTYYKKVLKLQPGNYIVSENLERIRIFESKKIKQVKYINLDPYLFLDIPGKTKTVTLVNCGQKAILAKLAIGQSLFLTVKKRRVEVRTQDEEYIGCLPDDISKRLTIFVKAGSIFSCFVKEAALKQTIIFLREEKKGKKVSKYASFPINIGANLHNLASGDEVEAREEEFEDLTDNDLEKLAETLNEEKEYLPYQSEDKEDEPEE